MCTKKLHIKIYKIELISIELKAFRFFCGLYSVQVLSRATVVFFNSNDQSNILNFIRSSNKIYL